MYYLLIYYSSNEIRRLLPTFLKAPNNEHKVCKEAMRNMWSCDFPFCDVQNYHGNLGIFVLKYHWIIIEILRGLFVGTLTDYSSPVLKTISGNNQVNISHAK